MPFKPFLSVAALALLALSGCGIGLCASEGMCDSNALFDNGSFSPRGMWSSVGGFPDKQALLVGDQVLLLGLTAYDTHSFPGKFAGLNTDGSLDSGFHLPVLNGADLYSGFRDPAGGFFLSGYFSEVDGIARAGFVRLHSNGTVDTAFDPGTGFSFPLGSAHWGDKFVPAPGGKFYAVPPSVFGYQTNFEDITRINADGSIDAVFNSPTFNPNGVGMVVVTDDGSEDIIALGDFTTLNAAPVDKGIARLNSNGTHDLGLNPASGFAGSPAINTALMVPGTNTFYVTGDFDTYNGTAVANMIRLLGNGTIDTTFNIGTGFTDFQVYTGGWLYFPVSSMIYASDASGDIYVGGKFKEINGTAQNYISRLNSDGSVDLGFASGTGFNSQVLSVAEIPDGSRDLFVAGYFTSYNGTSVGPFVRLSADGSLRAGFEAPSQLFGEPDSVVPIPGSTSLYVAGDISAYSGSSVNQIGRIRLDGTLDPTFSTASGFSGGHPSRLLVESTGGLYAAGSFTSYQGTAQGRIVRLDSSGNLNPSFNPGTGFGASVSEMALSEAGDALWVTGAFTTFNGSTISKGVARLLPSGALDPTFNHAQTGTNLGATRIVPLIDGTGRVLLGGSFTQYNSEPLNGMVLIQNSGTRDSSFSSGLPSGNVSAMAKTSKGFIIGGAFSSYGAKTLSCPVARIGMDGGLESGFEPGFTCTSVSDIAPHPTLPDHFYVSTQQYLPDEYLSRVVLMAPNGTEVRSFPFEGFIDDIAVATDGSQDLYVGGFLISYEGTALNHIARISPDGKLD